MLCSPPHPWIGPALVLPPPPTPRLVLSEAESYPDLLLVWGTCLRQQSQHKKHENHKNGKTNPESDHNGICKTGKVKLVFGGI